MKSHPEHEAAPQIVSPDATASPVRYRHGRISSVREASSEPAQLPVRNGARAAVRSDAVPLRLGRRIGDRRLSCVAPARSRQPSSAETDASALPTGQTGAGQQKEHEDSQDPGGLTSCSPEIQSRQGTVPSGTETILVPPCVGFKSSLHHSSTNHQHLVNKDVPCLWKTKKPGAMAELFCCPDGTRPNPVSSRVRGCMRWKQDNLLRFLIQQP